MNNSPTGTGTFARPKNGTTEENRSLVPSPPPLGGDERGRTSEPARPDHKICRKIYETVGLASVMKLTSLPFVDLRSVKIGETPQLAADYATALLRRLPFTRAIYCIGTGEVADISIEDTGDGDVEVYLITENVSGACILNTRDALRPHPLSGKPVVFVHEVRQLGAFRGAMVPPEAVARVALWCLKAVDTASEHLVEVTAVDENSRQAKTAKLKPWLVPPRRRIILLDPHEARKYGHRINRGGTHASPHPHQRRGHWATLRSERFKHKRGERVWVRPAWVGDREWVFEGNRYRVITREKQQND